MTRGSISMTSMLRFQNKYLKSGSYYSREAETEVRKPTKKLGTHLGFSHTCLKLCSRHATSQMHLPSLPSPFPAAPHWPRPWRAGMQLTGLETGFQHIWWNGNRPVEDSSQAPSKEDPGRTEFTHTVARVGSGGRKKEEKKKLKK